MIFGKMRAIGDTARSNLMFYLWVMWHPRYRELAHKYGQLKNPLTEYRRVLPKQGYYFCSFHSHTNSRSLEEVARVARQRGLDICFIMDHDSDDKFGIDMLKHYQFPEGQIYLVKGIECRCKDNRLLAKPKRTKMLFAMYDGVIEPNQPLIETVRRANAQRALIIPTTTLHTGTSGGISKRDINILMSDPDTRINAIETLDAGYGFVHKYINRHYWACAVAEHIANQYGLPVIWSSNDHIDEEMGVAGNFILKKDLPCLEHPDILMKNPRILREQLRNTFKRRAVMPVGYYSPALSFMKHKRRKIIQEDTGDSLKRKGEDLADIGRNLKDLLKGDTH
jgi:predicted metal-dependent phosphoesterase TrpH